MSQFKPLRRPEDQELYRHYVRRFDPKFQAQLQKYLANLEKSADENWWSLSPKALQYGRDALRSCAIDNVKDREAAAQIRQFG